MPSQGESEVALVPGGLEQAPPVLKADVAAPEAAEAADEEVEEGARETAPERVGLSEQIEELPAAGRTEPEEAEIGFAEPEIAEPAVDRPDESGGSPVAVAEEALPGLEVEEGDVTETGLERQAPEQEAELAHVVDETYPAHEAESVVKEPVAEVAEKPEEIAQTRQGEELPPQAARSDDGQVLADVQTLAEADALFWRETPEPLPALELGTVVNGRYQVSEVLLAEATEILYRVRDLMRCSQCGFAGNSPDQAFCSSCGAMLDQKPLALMLEHPLGQANEPVDTSVEDHFQEKDRTYWVWRESVGTAPLESEAQRAMRLLVGQKSDIGQKRELDEDSLLVLIMEGTYESLSDQLALFIVADGMGGHEGGEVASKLAIQTMVSKLMRDVFAPELEGNFLSGEEVRDRMVKAMKTANERVYLERKKRENDMGTTMTAALLKDWMLYLAHVGDCRAYRWGEAGLQQLTTDHSVVASMVAAGTMQPDEIYTHPHRSVIYRSIGDRPDVDVDSDVLPLDPGDRLLICCDGLWEMIRDQGIEEVMLAESDPQTACDVMVERANAAGGLDNISVIVVQL